MNIHTVKAWLPVSLAALCVILLPFGRSTELPMAVMAIWGLVLGLRRPGEMLRMPGIRLFAALFACFWLPMAASLPDAVNIDRALSTVLTFLRYLFVGFFVLYYLRTPANLRRLIWALSFTLALWSLDALLQISLGKDLLGHPYEAPRLKGIFHPEHKLGNVLAIFMPIFAGALAFLGKRRPWVWLGIAPYLAVILLSGSRAAWLMTTFAAVAYGVIALARMPATLRLRSLAAVLGMAILGTWTLSNTQEFKSHLERTSGLFSSDYEQIDKASSYRLPIWETGARMFLDHWINGIGPRGFRYLYPTYAVPGDRWVTPERATGPTHPHQITLEIAVETGAMGLLGFALFWGWWLRQWWGQRRQHGSTPLPWVIALGVVLSPLNPGHALYGSFTAGIVFLLLPLAVAAINPAASDSTRAN